TTKLIFCPPLEVMDESWVSGLTSSLSTFFNQEAQVAQVVEVLKNIGVCSSEDLKYVAADDLAAVLRPIEARKVMACIKTFHWIFIQSVITLQLRSLVSLRVKLLPAASPATTSSWIFAHSRTKLNADNPEQFLLDPGRNHFLHDFSTTIDKTTGTLAQTAQKLGLILDNQLLCEAHTAAKS
ncbi:hypothetical protein GBF38_021959, partial [Nibea albiflora]